MTFNILIVEDDATLREALVDTLELQASINVSSVGSAEDAIVLLNSQSIDLIVSDIQMTGLSGLGLLKKIHQTTPEIPVILMTAYGNIGDAVFAMQNGAADYMSKPFEPQMLLNKIETYMPNYHHDAFDPIAEDESSKKLLAMAKKVSETDATILISGKSGTGKEVLARYIHHCSKRQDKPFIAINCAAIPENMLEATLFGYEKGSFTGAIKSTEGKFEQAQHGTILLDEISEMDLGLQAKLLRVLQEKEVERIGSRKLIKLDVRVIATTNRDLKEYVKEGKFREDLYYRLNVFPLNWLPLSQRQDDIIPLANYFLEKFSKKQGVSTPTFSEDCLKKLLHYSWPGNIREMENVIQRAFILKTGDKIESSHIYIEEDGDLSNSSQNFTNTIETQFTQDFTVETVSKGSAKKENLNTLLKEQENKKIIQALKKFDGNRVKMAESLGISQRTLRYKIARMRKEGIEIS